MSPVCTSKLLHTIINRGVEKIIKNTSQCATWHLAPSSSISQTLCYYLLKTDVSDAPEIYYPILNIFLCKPVVFLSLRQIKQPTMGSYDHRCHLPFLQALIRRKKLKFDLQRYWINFPWHGETMTLIGCLNNENAVYKNRYMGKNGFLNESWCWRKPWKEECKFDILFKLQLSS